MGRFAVSLAILSWYFILFGDTMQCAQNQYKEEDNDMDFMLQLLNRPSSINATLQTLSTSSYCNRSGPNFPRLGRMTKKNISGETNSRSYVTKVTNRPNTHLAIARTKAGPTKYAAAVGRLKIDNPKAVGHQYSAVRIRLQAGADSIEAGWRVDPSLYGDTKTRFFIRTDTGNTHCFNLRCPGFILINPNFDMEQPLLPISILGGPTYSMRYYIIRNNANGNWHLVVGKKYTVVGYWPSKIFTKLSGFADRVEWGGAAYSPPGTPLPPMGSGNHPVGHPNWDGFVRNLRLINEKGQSTDAEDLEIYADNSKLYSVRDRGYHSEYWGHIIFFGGSGHP